MKNLYLLLFAQFFSALADNMVFIAAIAIIKEIYGSSSSYIPYLQESFVFAYIALAPFVGIFADSFPKNKVMVISNGIKILGVTSLIFGGNILFSYLLIGIGAAIYSPAKYGILIQLLPKEMLVKANSMLEGSTILAILSGVVLGGILIDKTSIEFGLKVIFFIYFSALILNMFMKNVVAEHTFKKMSIFVIFKNFYMNIKLLIEDRKTRTSILAISNFWGLGSMLRLFLFSWIPFIFLINDNSTPANLMGVLSVGVVVGAVLAAKYFNLENALKSLKFGLILGFLIFLVAFIKNIYLLGFVLFLVGIFGGLLVIPLNAFIQEKGHHKLGVGNALAVQNFFENIFMIFILALYNAFLYFKVSLIYIPMFFGFYFFFIFILFLRTKKIELIEKNI